MHNTNIISENAKTKTSYNLTIVCISFKINNIFISVSEFIKFFNFFILNRLLQTYSCGTAKNIQKTSIDSYKPLSDKLKIFLLNNKIKKIHLIFKSSKKLTYIFLNMLLHTLYNCKHITISSIYLDLTISFNGCKIQKRKFR